MGITNILLQIANPATPDDMLTVPCLVDSGAVYSVIPRRILNQLGIKPLIKEKFRLANGEFVEREKGVAIFRYGDRIGGSDVIFGEENDAELCGAFTLEALGLALDPLRRELKPLQLVM